MEKNPVRELKTKRELAERICQKLIAAGDPATPERVVDVINRWVAAHRVPDLPSVGIAIATSVILDRIDRHFPGALDRLE